MDTNKKSAAQAQAVNGSTSDGYHTFDELYEFRKAYNAAFFNELAATNRCHVHKTWKHHDGELCFGGGWFMVAAVLPDGQISNHYEAKDWDLFRVAETEKALFEFDGHTGADVIARLCSYKPQAQAGDGEAVGKVYYTGNGFLDVDWYTSDIPDDALLYTRPQPAQVNQQLLEALQDLLAYVEQGIGDIESDEGRKARAAIAAAQEHGK